MIDGTRPPRPVLPASVTVADRATVFDRGLVARHRRRAAAGLPAHDFLLREAALRLADRLLDVTRRFPLALELSSRSPAFAQALADAAPGAVGQLITADLVPESLAGRSGTAIVCDEEWLPIAPTSLDLVASVLGLHWVNDLPGTLLQIRTALKPDGLFLASFLGGRTLSQLREVLAEAEIAETGGLSPRVSPVADVQDAARLLQRAGFALPVAEAELLEATYPDALALMRELRGMGESNALIERLRRPTRRAVILRAAALYAERYSDGAGRIRANFEVVTMTGWAPAPTQQQPLKPGSAAARLADALQTAEHSAGEKTAPG